MPEIAAAASQMPKYRCHKDVWALKILDVQLAERPTVAELDAILNTEGEVPVEILPDGSFAPKGLPGATLIVEEPFAPIVVDSSYVRRHMPKPGGYYVVYKDGYKSFSPADAFEDGYTRI
jgi:hypothetical protein